MAVRLLQFAEIINLGKKVIERKPIEISIFDIPLYEVDKK